VALLASNLLVNASDFSAGTKPTKTAVDSIIDWVSAQVDMQYGQAGYKVPFVVLTGESWPTPQTNFLTMLAVFAATAHISGHVLKPAPAVAPGREGGSGNIFQDLFNRELRKIWDGRKTHLRWRADFYAGTPAEKALTEPSGPGLDFMEEQFDPTRHENMWNITERIRKVQLEVAALGLEWDYMFNYKSYNAGLGNVN